MARLAGHEMEMSHRPLGHGPEERAGMRQSDEQEPLRCVMSAEVAQEVRAEPCVVQPAVLGQVQYQQVRLVKVPDSAPWALGPWQVLRVWR